MANRGNLLQIWQIAVVTKDNLRAIMKAVVASDVCKCQHATIRSFEDIANIEAADRSVCRIGPLLEDKSLLHFIVQPLGKVERKKVLCGGLGLRIGVFGRRTPESAAANRLVSIDNEVITSAP